MTHESSSLFPEQQSKIVCMEIRVNNMINCGRLPTSTLHRILPASLTKLPVVYNYVATGKNRQNDVILCDDIKWKLLRSTVTLHLTASYK